MIYLAILILLLCTALIPERKKGVVSYIFLYLILTLVAGLRYRVGGDTLAYINDFNKLPQFADLPRFDYLNAPYNPLWYIFNAFVKAVWNDFVFFQLIHAAIVNGAVFWFFNKYCKYKYVAVLFYYILYYTYFNMEILRESLAIAVFLLSVPSLIAKKWFKYYTLAFIAVFLHSSAMMLFFLPILYKRLSRKYILLMCLLLILLPIINIENVLMIFSFTDQIAIKIKSYMSSEINIFGVLMQLLVVLPTLVFHFVRKKNDIGQHVFQNNVSPYLIIGILSLILGGFYRFLNYLALLNVVYLADTFCSIQTLKKSSNYSSKLANFAIVMLLIHQIYYYVRDTSEYRIGTRFYMLYFPYHTVFDPQIELNRERIYINMMDLDYHY
ncbi:EpsG family protein [Olivibacter jilunii]|uniref:EpsG family protein n=1 Tax=Olivibacter jilunii TaxID=985016 RepID=UPI00103185A5